MNSITYTYGYVLVLLLDRSTCPIKIYTIGFKGKTAKNFFETLKEHGIQKLIDVRRKNISQLAGYAKGHDLKYFLQECFNIAYEHLPDFGPSNGLLEEYRNRLGKKKKDDAAWAFYVEQFNTTVLSMPLLEQFNGAVEDYQRICLLCSEETAERCHRRLLAEHFKEKRSDIEIHHI